MDSKLILNIFKDVQFKFELVPKLPGLFELLYLIRQYFIASQAVKSRNLNPSLGNSETSVEQVR